eukprot:COSAG02_NODE_4594_length_5181_cov_2.684179_3_plen_57_part_00
MPNPRKLTLVEEVAPFPCDPANQAFVHPPPLSHANWRAVGGGPGAGAACVLAHGVQ